MSPMDYGRIPPRVLGLCRRLQENGREAYLVGGSVRDLLRGREVHDWDVATDAPPPEVQRLFPRTIPTGIKHGTVTVIVEDGLAVEVTTYRGEAQYSDGRHPDSVRFVRTIEEDLSRRDFTMNAMALDPVGRALVDPLHGGADLEARLIRAVGDPLARFTEDGLRPLRALRFAAVLGFQVEEATLLAIPAAIHRFRLVSAERVREEFLKLLCAPRPSVGIELMFETGLLVEVLPEVVAGRGVKQNRFHSEDVYWHSLHACDAVQGDAVLRLATLLHDVGKPLVVKPHPDREGESTFLGHEAEGATLCDAIGRRMKLSGEERERLCHLVAHHRIELGGWTPPGLRRFLRRVGPEHLDDLFALRAADLGCRPDAGQSLERLALVRERLEEIRKSQPALNTSQLAIDGRAVMARLDVGPGPQVGEILRALLERVIEEPGLNEREALLRMVDELLAPGHGSGSGRGAG
jgi:putative nucleotidyltransferase with HDIG domain